MFTYYIYIFKIFEYNIYPNRHLPKLEDPPHIHPYVVHKRQSNKTFDVMHQVFCSTEPRWRCIWGVCTCWVDRGKERFQNYLRFIGSFLSWTNHLCSNYWGSKFWDETREGSCFHWELSSYLRVLQPFLGIHTYYLLGYVEWGDFSQGREDIDLSLAYNHLLSGETSWSIKFRWHFWAKFCIKLTKNYDRCFGCRGPCNFF